MRKEFILLKRKDFRPKKRLGQHFLYDPAIAAKIIDAAGLTAGQTVIELGAGKGILTTQLSQRSVRVIAIERDDSLCEALSEQFGGCEAVHEDAAPAVEILNVDFTKISLTGLLASRGVERCVLIGNIPYNLTREVLFSFLVDEFEIVGSALLMLQKEVGERIVSSPGSRVYGVTSVILQCLYSIRTVLKVVPGSFSPRPKVASIVLAFDPLPEPLVEPDEFKYFIKFVKNLFQQRRKTIHNSMKASYELPETALKEIQALTGIDLRYRPEDLSNHEFLRLSRSLVEVIKA